MTTTPQDQKKDTTDEATDREATGGRSQNPPLPAHQEPEPPIFQFLDALRAAEPLTDLELLTRIGDAGDTRELTPTTWACFLELQARTRLETLRRNAPHLRADRLQEGAHTIADRAQQVVNALAEGTMTPQAANTALYALQVAASALRQISPGRRPGRPPGSAQPKKIPPPTPTTGAGGAHVRRRTPPKEKP